MWNAVFVKQSAEENVSMKNSYTCKCCVSLWNSKL